MMSKTKLTGAAGLYRDELIQIAAVAVAAITNLDYGSSEVGIKVPVFGTHENAIFSEILTERIRQKDIWGVKDRHPFLWTTILGEEFGEACEAALKFEFGKDEQGESDYSEAVTE